MKPYTIIIERDPDSGWLVGEVVELPGCYSQAPDLPTLEHNMREAITVHLSVVDAEPAAAEFIGTWRIEVAV